MQWALKNQGTRRNLTDEEIKKCEREALMRLGRRYNAEKSDKKKTLKRGNSPKPQAGETGGSTVQKIAKEEGVSKNTVERAGARMEIHDAVEEVAPEVASAVLDMKQEDVQEVRKAVREAGNEEKPTVATGCFCGDGNP